MYGYTDGTSFEGDFVANCISGNGTYIWPDGSTYTGGVERGVRHGNGVLQLKNSGGALGDGSTTNRNKFTKVVYEDAQGAEDAQGTEDAQAVAAGIRHSLLLKKDGSVWGTGENTYGQLGDGSTTDRKKFKELLTSGVKAISAGSYHSLVLNLNGSVWVTGWNNCGQFGDGTKMTTIGDDSIGAMNTRTRFVMVISSGVQAVAAGAYFSLGLKTDGSVLAAVAFYRDRLAT